MSILSGSEPSTTTTIDVLGRSALHLTPSTSFRSFFDFGDGHIMYQFRTNTQRTTVTGVLIGSKRMVVIHTSHTPSLQPPPPTAA